MDRRTFTVFISVLLHWQENPQLEADLPQLLCGSRVLSYAELLTELLRIRRRAELIMIKGRTRLYESAAQRCVQSGVSARQFDIELVYSVGVHSYTYEIRTSTCVSFS